MGTETTIYIGGLFEKVTKPSGVIEYKHYVMAGREAMAIRTLRSNDANDTRYLHKDHLGNVDAITNESGAVIQRLSYDAFGKRREAIAWSGPLTSGDWTSIAAITHRGFTFHEHLDNVDLIHMNGRVYDPDMGRFISADPFIQAPLMSQSLNRYSYVMNNPLSLIDPSGFSWLSKKWKKLTRWARRQWDSFRRDLNNIVGFALMLIPIPGLQQLGAAIFLSPVRVHRGRDGYYVSVGYAGFGVDNRPGSRISTSGGGSPPPMTPPAGAMSLRSPSSYEYARFNFIVRTTLIVGDFVDKVVRSGVVVLNNTEARVGFALGLEAKVNLVGFRGRLGLGKIVVWGSRVTLGGEYSSYVTTSGPSAEIQAGVSRAVGYKAQ